MPVSSPGPLLLCPSHHLIDPVSARAVDLASAREGRSDPEKASVRFPSDISLNSARCFLDGACCLLRNDQLGTVECVDCVDLSHLRSPARKREAETLPLPGSMAT